MFEVRYTWPTANQLSLIAVPKPLGYLFLTRMQPEKYSSNLLEIPWYFGRPVRVDVFRIRVSELYVGVTSHFRVKKQKNESVIRTFYTPQQVLGYYSPPQVLVRNRWLVD